MAMTRMMAVSIKKAFPAIRREELPLSYAADYRLNLVKID